MTGKVIEKDSVHPRLNVMDEMDMELLYREGSERIYNFLFKFTNNSELSQDLLQDTFLNFFKRYKNQALGKDNAMMILYTIARNNSINHFKKASNRKEMPILYDAKDQQESFADKLEKSDLQAQLLQCLQELPEDQKTAVILKNMDDLKLQEIATIMDTSISSVSRLIVKGTSHLLQTAAKKGIQL